MRPFRLLSLLAACALLAGAARARTESIVLGGGCFWCMDASYKLLPGVVHVTCGYAGGTMPHPTYQEVCTETTGYAEVVKVDYDPDRVSLARVLDYFWDAHNPTQVGGQGPDMGSSYRSIILYASEAQRLAAERSKAEAQKSFQAPITTEIVPLEKFKFWRAEEYHQDFFAKHPDQAYCTNEIQPKVDHLKRLLQTQAARPPKG
ncbi:MAG TPA: peptide-methionine (S)-S-oxide reductase MsrA [Opitutaceae bacterium]|nr:peptide-methionine (S)-S-oxide reductase MsrA [Opitutaceae bacterium]